MGDLEPVDDWPEPRPSLPVRDPSRFDHPIAYAIVVAANPPLCLWFGMATTDGSGKVGMLAGIPLLYGIGWLLLRRSRPAGIDMLVGGAIMASSQFVMYAQLIAGTIGLMVGYALAGDANFDTHPNMRQAGFFAALVATLVTGGLLMAAAMILGFCSRAITPTSWRYPVFGPIKPMRLTPDAFRDF